MDLAIAQAASKLPDVGVTIFTVMTRLAAEHGALNLAQGFPDFDCDPALVAAVSSHMKRGNNQYAPMQGVLALREALAMKIRRLYGAAYDPAHRDHDHVGRDRGALLRHLGLRQPRRRSGARRAVLRLVRARGSPQRRPAGVRDAPLPRLPASTGTR